MHMCVHTFLIDSHPTSGYSITPASLREGRTIKVIRICGRGGRGHRRKQKKNVQLLVKNSEQTAKCTKVDRIAQQIPSMVTSQVLCLFSMTNNSREQQALFHMQYVLHQAMLHNHFPICWHSLPEIQWRDIKHNYRTSCTGNVRPLLSDYIIINLLPLLEE